MSEIEIETLKQELRQEFRQEIEALKRQMHAAPNFSCLTYDELADAAGCCPATIRQYEKEGKLYPRYPNAKRRFHPEDVALFLRGQAGKKQRKEQKA